jgi:PadR family transcriptional regulator, regulatory protein PadR
MAAEQKIEARPRNWLTPVALVLLKEESSYGYEILERLEEEFGFEQISAGTVYRSLRRTEKEGLSKSEWETSEGGVARRMYSITEEGESYLAAWAKACEQYQNVMDSFSRAYTSR